MDRLFDHGFIFATVVCTVYSQLIMRWRVTLAGPLPVEFMGRVEYVASLLFSPWILSAILATFMAGVSWMLAMTKFELSYAYPFVSLNFILVIFAGFLLFNEALTAPRIIGSALVIVGILILARS